MQSYQPTIMRCMPLVYLSIPTIAAMSPPVFSRGDSPPYEIPPEWLKPDPPPKIEEVYGMVELNDGPTHDGVAGIGAEFETIGIQFTQGTCNLADTFKAKRKKVEGRSGLNFELSVDTSVEQGQGRLSAEYVLDGREIKVGRNMAAAAARAARNDLAKWTPWTEIPPNQIKIEKYVECPGPWTVRNLNVNSDKDKIVWVPQVTTPMPLEALYFLMKENVLLGHDEVGRNILNGNSLMRGQNLHIVTKRHFEPLKKKVFINDINDAVLGFCTLVLSYAKAADKKPNPTDRNAQERSPKSSIPFMPRTEFITIYQAIKTIFPLCHITDDSRPHKVDLLEIFEVLACYKAKVQGDDFDLEIDENYCTGTVEAPVPGKRFGELQYTYIGQFADPGVSTTMKIAEWIDGIAQGYEKPDMLTNFDKHYDSSIGGLGEQVENMYRPADSDPGATSTDRAAPLFEFRDLIPVRTEQFEQFMSLVDADIQKLHTDFAARPWKKGRRDGNTCQLNNATSLSTAKPFSSHPPFSNRTSSKPGQSHPTSLRQPFSNRTSSHPATSHPPSSHSTLSNQTSSHPTSFHSSFSHQNTWNPSLANPTSSNHTLSQSSTPPPTTSAPTMPSCTLQNEDPDQGINRRGCICGSSTLPLLTIPNATDNEQSCSYTAMPTSKVANPVTIESQVYTDNCYPCTLIGGIADTPSCATTTVNGCTPTTPAVPTATVFLSNNSVPIGDKNNQNNGTDFRTELYTKLRALCPDKANTCDSTTPGEFDHIETIVGNEPIEETVKFTIQDSHYDSTRERDQLIAAAVATWQQAVSKTCQEIPYDDYEDLTASGCGTGPVKRGTLVRALMTPEERRLKPRYALPEPVCDNCSPAPPPTCHYKATICSGPDHINPILGNNRNGPYANHMNIQLTYEIGQGNSLSLEFICDAVIEGLTALAMIVAPELASLEIWQDLELETLCADLGDQIGTRAVNSTTYGNILG